MVDQPPSPLSQEALDDWYAQNATSQPPPNSSSASTPPPMATDSGVATSRVPEAVPVPVAVKADGKLADAEMQAKVKAEFGENYSPPPAPQYGVQNAPSPAPQLQRPIMMPPVAQPRIPASEITGLPVNQNVPNGTPPGGIRSTPQQATADQLNALRDQGLLTGEEGAINADALAKLADKQDEIATEKKRQGDDFTSFLKERSDKYDQALVNTKETYDKYREQRDIMLVPSAQFFKDSPLGSVGGRIAAAFAGFASGLGGKSDSFLNYLNNRINENYHAHQDYIQDLYKDYVNSGKIADTVENHTAFMQKAKLASYDLAAAHLTAEMQSIKDRSTGQIQRVLADKTISGLQQQGIIMRQQLAHTEAAQAAAALAQKRAEMKEMRTQFVDLVKHHLTVTNGDNEGSRAAAAQDLLGLGYPRSAVAEMLGGAGFSVSPEGKITPPTPTTPAGPSEVSIDPTTGEVQVPTRNANGGFIKPEEQDKMREDAQKRTVIVDGKPQLAINEETAKKYQAFSEAEPEARRLALVMKDAIAKGDRGSYDQARQASIELAPKLYGFTRGPSGAQAGEGGETSFLGDPKGTVAGQIPEWSAAGAALRAQLAGQGPMSTVDLQKLNGWVNGIDHLRNTAREQTFLHPTGQIPVETPKVKPPSAADIAKKKGWVSK